MIRSTTTRHRLLTPLFFTKPPTFSSISAAAVADFPQNDCVSQILGHFNSPLLCYSTKLLFNYLRDNVSFRNEVLKLGPSEIDTVIDKLSSENAIEFFFLLQNKFGVKHSRNAKFVIAHCLAEKKRSRALRCHLERVLQEEGNLHFFVIILFDGVMFYNLIDNIENQGYWCIFFTCMISDSCLLAWKEPV